ncbi:MAG: UDPGP type 1 family protein [Planctomycetales bacterium]|nr:UDPGP type 1 family protein [Planctomycetales bacterium]
MPSPQVESLDARFQRSQQTLLSRDQAHVLAWWDDLDAQQRDQLLSNIESIDWDVVDPLIDSHVKRSPELKVPTPLDPAPSFRKATFPADNPNLCAKAKEVGTEFVRAGKLAAFVVAGGQGTRLGFDGPKGAVPVTPVKEKSLFQLFAEMLLAAGDRFGVAIPWYIMTSRTNHDATIDFFRQHQFFGLQENDVFFFSQGMLPAFDRQGKLLLAEKHLIAMAPDGHGGSLKALYNSGALADMRRRGIECISYFQVDNPLVMPVDALFVGLHRTEGAEMSCKVSPKTDDLERVGNVCLSNGRVHVVEYSDFPESLAQRRNEDGSRTYDSGNLAMHLIDVQFIERIVGEGVDLIHHRADKATPFLNASGEIETPSDGEKNSVKLEKFVFDALPLAENVVLLEIERAEEFSPVKAAAGTDSKETSIRDQVRRAANWLESAGVAIPRNASGEPDATLEIAPRFASSAEDVQDKDAQLPLVEPGSVIYLD